MCRCAALNQYPACLTVARADHARAFARFDQRFFASSLLAVIFSCFKMVVGLGPLRTAALCLLLAYCIEAFAPQLSPSTRRSAATALAAKKRSTEESVLANFVATSALAAALTFGVVASPALADEYGRETEAPTLFTGENVMVGSFSLGCL